MRAVRQVCAHAPCMQARASHAQDAVPIWEELRKHQTSGEDKAQLVDKILSKVVWGRLRGALGSLERKRQGRAGARARVYARVRRACAQLVL